MTQSYLEHLAADRRLVILRLLQEARGSANESVLHAGVQMLGHRATREMIRTDLDWMRDRHLVTQEVAFDVVVAKITRRGLNVASGDEACEGVKTPSIV